MERVMGPTLRRLAYGLVQGLGWIGVLALIGASLLLVRRLGFPAVLLLGLIASLICVRAELSQDVPGWGRDIFAARWHSRPDASERLASAEQIAALRFYRNCGFALILAGALGSVWQVWRIG
ncbi:hypothetical protein RQ831_07320 [Roseomonas gilardii]|uniref:Uncharacterized protein n=2 Tax=Roseomonas gilardii TaxID=257708 RepID=A0ABU3MDB7_9PROT|nr:hypothetical protein [Roseomonas gilardii]MDT8330859.1 hypothetical protein [Roseomonas gilardii]